jgi:hypothetical protein
MKDKEVREIGAVGEPGDGKRGKTTRDDEYSGSARSWKSKKRLIAIAIGLNLLAAGTAFAYWQYLQRQWCVQFASSGGQEVTYSRGCYNPERYKKWSVTASAKKSDKGRRENSNFKILSPQYLTPD